MSCLFTIFTPTYNRAYTLERLYSSLKSQTYKNFEWLIVDDGSTDGTKDLVDSFIEDGMLDIKYFFKKNEGKHIAINYGSQRAKGDWFFMVDSDDYLLDNALERVVYYLNQIMEEKYFAGVVGLKGNQSGDAWLSWQHEECKGNGKVDKGYIDADAIEYRYLLKAKGDRSEIVKTELVQKYPFPYFEGEKFITEKYLWMQLANEGYKFRWFNEVIYIAEYLQEGLTKSIKSLYQKNHRGRCFVDNYLLLCRRIPIKERVRACVNYYRFGIIGNVSIIELYKESYWKFASLPCIMLAYFKVKKN